jgi:hypothetical protein
LAEIHGGECGCHAASANLVGKAYRFGFYWPTAMTDAKDLVKRFKGCQLFAKQQHLPAQALRTIPPSWPFAMWGFDSVGPFRNAPGGYRFILVAVDKFTKWIEVRPIAKVTSEEAAKFMQDIIPPRHDLHRVHLLGFLPRQHYRRLLLLSRPPSVQRPGRACQRHGPLSSQRSYL